MPWDPSKQILKEAKFYSLNSRVVNLLFALLTLLWIPNSNTSWSLQPRLPPTFAIPMRPCLWAWDPAEHLNSSASLSLESGSWFAPEASLIAYALLCLPSADARVTEATRGLQWSWPPVLSYQVALADTTPILILSLIPNHKLSVGLSILRQNSMHSSCSLTNRPVAPENCISLHCNTPAVEDIPLSFCNPDRIVPLQLHTDLLVFVPHAVCISVQALQRGTRACWFVRKGWDSGGVRPRTGTSLLTWNCRKWLTGVLSWWFCVHLTPVLCLSAQSLTPSLVCC